MLCVSAASGRQEYALLKPGPRQHVHHCLMLNLNCPGCCSNAHIYWRLASPAPSWLPQALPGTASADCAKVTWMVTLPCHAGGAVFFSIIHCQIVIDLLMKSGTTPSSIITQIKQKLLEVMIHSQTCLWCHHVRNDERLVILVSPRELVEAMADAAIRAAYTRAIGSG